MFNTRILSDGKPFNAATGHPSNTTVTYSDLGLPSGTQWKGVDATDMHRGVEAETARKNIARIPTVRQWIELFRECRFRVRTQSPALLRGESPNRKEVILPLKGQLFGRAIGTVRCWAKDEATGFLMVLQYTDARRFEFYLAEDDTRQAPRYLMMTVNNGK